MMRTKLSRGWRRNLHVATSKAWRDIDETCQLLPAPEAIGWSALIVDPRMEAKAASALREAGHVVWYPQTVETITRAHRHLRIKVNRPLFPRYLFAAHGRSRKGMIDCDHVSAIVGPVPQSLLADLSRRQDGGEFVATLRESAYRRGARVRVVEGGYGGLDGIVNVSTDKRIIVLIEMMGRQVPVEMDVENVRAA